MSRLVLFVEGEGDVEAAPVLVSRLWTELPPELQIGFVDTKPLRIGGLARLTGRFADKWPHYPPNRCWTIELRWSAASARCGYVGGYR